MNDKLIEALQALDVSKAGDWNEDGKPNLVRVRTLSKNEKLTRQDIEAVAAGFVRSNATSFFDKPEEEIAPEVTGTSDASKDADSVKDRLEVLSQQLQEKAADAARLKREREEIFKEREALLAVEKKSHQDQFFESSQRIQEAAKKEALERANAYQSLKAQGLDVQALSALGSASPLDVAMAHQSVRVL